MGLQVRLVHALADRLMELEPRPGGGPLVVGRSAEADIQIPSLNVSRKHAMLYPRDGGWILQDAGGGRGTFVNGQPVTGLVQLASGDVVTLGSDPTPATLVIDPYGAGAAATESADENGEAVIPEPVVPEPKVKSHRAPRSGGLPQPVGKPAVAAAPASSPARRSVPMTPPPPPPHAAAAFAAPADEAAADEQADWMTAGDASTPSTGSAKPRKYKPRQQVGTGLILVTVALSALIVGGAIWLYIKRSSQPVVVVTEPAPVKKAPATKPLTRVADGFHASDVSPGSGTGSGSTANASGTKMASNSSSRSGQLTLPVGMGKSGNPGGPSTDTGGDEEMAKPIPPADKEWAKIEDAHSVSPPIVAVAIYDDYMRIFPQSPHVPEVKKYVEEAMDLIWWRRISDLIKKQEELKKDMVRKDAELAAETSPDFKKKLGEEKADIQKELSENEEQLKYMKYDLQDPPNLGDGAALKVLRQARDPKIYDTWKERVYAKIKMTRGAKAF